MLHKCGQVRSERLPDHEWLKIMDRAKKENNDNAGDLRINAYKIWTSPFMSSLNICRELFICVVKCV